MSNGFLINNTIYMCLAEDVLTNAINKELPQELITKIYFPYLNEKRINTIEKLKEKKIELLESNKQLLNKTFEKNDKNIDMFHKVYNTRKEELKYIEQGIQFIELNLSQEVEFSIPLDTIFKLIHTSKELPFIKYSASNRQENIYKLYCDKVAKNGKKIPYLSKSQIFKLIKETKGKKSVSCYMEYYVSENNENNENNEKSNVNNEKSNVNNEYIPIHITIDNYTNIYVKCEFKQTKSVNFVENILKNAVNPVINIIKDYVKKNGYTMTKFSSIYSDNIEIVDIKYVSYISIDKNINFNNLLGCISSIFNVVVGDLKKGIIMRYKRVAEYNVMDSQEAFIVELLNRANEENDIVKLLMDNFQLKEEEAQLKIAELLNNLQVVQSLNKKRSIKIKNNPGFLTKITQDAYKKNITVEMDKINNIFYMQVIPIYIDSLIRITQVPETSDVNVREIDNLCKTSKISLLLFKCANSSVLL